MSLFRELLKNKWSVRKVEEICQHLKNGEDLETGKKKIQAKNQLPEEYTRMKNDLSGYFQAKVQLSCTAKGKGKISIPFNDQADLERIMQLFARMKDNNLPEE